MRNTKSRLINNNFNCRSLYSLSDKIFGESSSQVSHIYIWEIFSSSRVFCVTEKLQHISCMYFEIPTEYAASAIRIWYIHALRQFPFHRGEMLSPYYAGMMINGRYVTPKLSLIFRAFPTFSIYVYHIVKVLYSAMVFRAYFDGLISTQSPLNYCPTLKEVSFDNCIFSTHSLSLSLSFSSSFSLFKYMGSLCYR